MTSCSRKKLLAWDINLNPAKQTRPSCPKSQSPIECICSIDSSLHVAPILFNTDNDIRQGETWLVCFMTNLASSTQSRFNRLSPSIGGFTDALMLSYSYPSSQCTVGCGTNIVLNPGSSMGVKCNHMFWRAMKWTPQWTPSQTVNWCSSIGEILIHLRAFKEQIDIFQHPSIFILSQII